MSENEPVRKWDWHEVRALAQTRPAMFIGSQENGHKLGIMDVLRLVWQAKVFRRPQSVTVDLSPTQYVVRADCGPLIRPIQQILSFGTGNTIAETWGQEWRAYYDKIKQADEETGIDFLQQRHRYGWRYCFSGPTGPRLSSPSKPFILARCGVWGLRTNAGLWCETYSEGIPVSEPFLLNKLSPIGLFAAAALDPEWFIGLPLTEEDARQIAQLSHRRYDAHAKYPARPLWTPGEIIANWHPQDDLIPNKMLTADGLQGIL